MESKREGKQQKFNLMVHTRFGRNKTNKNQDPKEEIAGNAGQHYGSQAALAIEAYTDFPHLISVSLNGMCNEA
ncbi:unnamed protein product [Dovyalis caffra]|uniref:Uncharacterized protein n=1 Tax=Dovyalis caffra TaxID=77055 RepID=A0AAV1ST81_9ROSI|nr:unnamed protein product [Dovyalis caffra]